MTAEELAEIKKANAFIKHKCAEWLRREPDEKPWIEHMPVTISDANAAFEHRAKLLKYTDAQAQRIAELEAQLAARGSDREALVAHFRSRMTPPFAAPETLAQEGFIERWNKRADKKAEEDADALLSSGALATAQAEQPMLPDVLLDAADTYFDTYSPKSCVSRESDGMWSCSICNHGWYDGDPNNHADDCPVKVIRKLRERRSAIPSSPATAQAEQREHDRLLAGTHMSRQKTAEDYERIKATAPPLAHKKSAGNCEHNRSVDRATAQAVTPTDTASEIELEALACAIFQERCPGIRYLEQDRALYEAAAKAALNVLTQATAAGAQRGEGERT